MKFDQEDTKQKSTENSDNSTKDSDLEELTSNEKDIQSTIKQWFQDNLRIIVSILIVVLIAGGIYSYSKRSEAPTKESGVIATQDSNQKSGSVNKDNKDDKGNKDNKEESSSEKTTTEKATKEKTATKKEASTKKTSSVIASQETEKSFVETAAKGDSQTTLAREALANFLAKNEDSSLTAEHKIYIEDYLRKNVTTHKRIHIGTSVEFSKSLIQKAITQSKTLNSNQLKNLHKYTLRVKSFS